AALSGFENDGVRDFDIGVYGGVDGETYATLEPFQWPAPGRADGNFYTPDRKARFIAIRPTTEVRTSPDYPLILNTGRIRDHW
ncbi:hypothetical protein, partial [Mesorhizobium sp. M7A.F.Ca.CA.004.09.1.2]|uniref:hypothetical protein n=1 Tax=Mesorhizobium sp. M7A.F.Ca.CA.004.09.1.2 TaxID=2496695 RepID=UPI000FD55953